MANTILGDLEDQITCWICFETFKEPITLECNHSFCKECLVKMYKKNPLCAFCRRAFNLPLPPVNKALEQLVLNAQKGAASSSPRQAIPQDALILQLPDEILLDVFGFLPIRDLGRAARVSRDFRRLADDNVLWREHCRNRFPFCRVEKYGGDWKKCFLSSVRFQRGWTEVPLWAPDRIRSHVSCFSFYRSNVVTGSADQTVKIWKIRKPADEDDDVIPLFTLNGHAGIIRAVDFNEIRIISAATDSTLKLWDTANGSVQATLHHTAPTAVECFAADEAKIVSGASNNEIKVWDIRTAEPSRFHGNTVMTAGNSTKLWDLRNGAVLATMPAGRAHLLSDRVLVFNNSGLSIYNYNGALQQSFGGFAGITATFADQDFACAGLSAGAVHVFDLKKGAQVHVLSEHTQPVQAVQCDGRRLVSGSDDNSLKVWDLSNGKRLYSLLGGSLQRRGNNPAPPGKPGCSGLKFDEGRIVASFQNLVRVYSFED